MKFNDYQELALRTARDTNSDNLILNGALGLNGEAGEVADIVKKHMFQGHDRDHEKLVYELGDILWYVAILAKGLGVDMETVATWNVEKLMKRYPDGFKTENSVNRGEN